MIPSPGSGEESAPTTGVLPQEPGFQTSACTHGIPISSLEKKPSAFLVLHQGLP